MWIIGVDGGGTKCEASIFTIQGELLASALAGPSNLFANFTGAIAEIEKACNKLLEICNEQHNLTIHKQQCILSLGCAGGGIGFVKQAFEQWPHQYAHAILSTDAQSACLAANAGQNCALFVIGTGSCLAVYTTDAGTKQFGGHGFLLGDIASGAWLGKHAVSWYLQATETSAIGEKTAIKTAIKTDHVLQKELASTLGSNTSHIVQQYGQASPALFAALAPILIGVKDSSPAVQQWLDEGANYAANLLISHTSKNLPIFLTGGLSHIYKPLIEKRIKKELYTPQHTPVYGAYLLALNEVKNIR